MSLSTSYATSGGSIGPLAASHIDVMDLHHPSDEGAERDKDDLMSTSYGLFILFYKWNRWHLLVIDWIHMNLFKSID